MHEDWQLSQCHLYKPVTNILTQSWVRPLGSVLSCVKLAENEWRSINCTRSVRKISSNTPHYLKPEPGTNFVRLTEMIIHTSCVGLTVSVELSKPIRIQKIFSQIDYKVNALKNYLGGLSKTCHWGQNWPQNHCFYYHPRGMAERYSGNNFLKQEKWNNLWISTHIQIFQPA